MKLLKITAAIAAVAAVSTAQAETISGGGLSGVSTDGGTASAVSAVAVVGSTQLLDGLRSMQGFDAACTGNVSMLCAPTISSAELRAIMTNSITRASDVLGGGTDLGTASGFTGKTGVFKEYAAAGVLDAMRSFTGSGVVGGFSCGQGGLINITNSAQANDAATIASASAGASLGFVHATELDGSIGFIKLDGVAPSALALASSNYNLVSNLSADNGVADSSVNGMTVGVVGAGSGVASHSPAACSPLTPGSVAGDTNGGSI